jgi:hypothetical protein
MDLKTKRFLVIPRDAFERLGDRHAEYEEAVERAKERAGEEGQAFYVVESKAIVTREAPPVKVRKL